MENKMKDIDQLIKETLSQEEAKFYDDLDEQNLLEMLGGLFNTKHRWIIVLMNIATVVAFGFLVYCIIQFLNTDDTNQLIKWFAGGAICFMVIGMTKLFAWMQMDKNALLREIKRLELQVSSIAGKISQ
ncbi:hypothetical protein ATO12_04450 [Aquimarina atlantica]|uniref:Uncharacterized protein n=1 Tax=Aquimarina atlantica TaxID=1317122 RepID=A0A023C199_9FLAO|nr:DUF6768 family protein [Aquimarina atlantica]EZH76046.1 hypothetical protein ATO12_04450 [Aquimarina atlantica]